MTNRSNPEPILSAVPALTSSAEAKPPKRALVVKFGSIGDVIMAVPGAAALHASGYAIDWVASEAIAPILRLYPWIEVIAVDEPALLRGSYPTRFSTWSALSKALRGRARCFGPYDTLATLYYDRRYSWLTSLVPARRRVSLSRTDRLTALLPGRHHTDEYARILLARPDKETPWQFAPVPPPLLPPSPRALQPGKRRVVLVPAGARNVLRDDALRRWPVENYVTLAGDLLRTGYEIVLAGGRDDRWASSNFAALAAGARPEAFADLIGSLSLVDTLALLHSASVIVTHDTGPLHMAGITGAGIVSIFGPTDPHGRLPRRGNTVAIWGGEGFACRPCYDGRDYAPCPHNGCMAQVTPPMVSEAVETLAQARAEGRELPPRVDLPEPAPFVQIRQGTRP